MRVLVTGGAGFIGSALVDRLIAEGCDVDAIDDLSTGSLGNLAGARATRNRRFSFHRLDVGAPQLTDLVTRRRPEVIFHLAAQLDVRVSVAKPMFDAQVNILGSLNVCEAALAGGTRKVVFAGSGGIFRGWQAVLGRYKRTYPDRAAMGHTTFTALEITELAPDAALAIGHWHLKRANGELGGVFTLVLRKFPGGWQIILDHTSAMNPPPCD